MVGFLFVRRLSVRERRDLVDDGVRECLTNTWDLSAGKIEPSLNSWHFHLEREMTSEFDGDLQ
jgi:hypothetical protein